MTFYDILRHFTTFYDILQHMVFKTFCSKCVQSDPPGQSCRQWRARGNLGPDRGIGLEALHHPLKELPVGHIPGVVWENLLPERPHDRGHTVQLAILEDDESGLLHGEGRVEAEPIQRARPAPGASLPTRHSRNQTKYQNVQMVRSFWRIFGAT